MYIIQALYIRMYLTLHGIAETEKNEGNGGWQ